MFLHTYRPSPILFNLGPFKIYWYGLLIVVAVFLGIWLTIFLSQREKIKKEEIIDLSFYLLIFSFLGARIFYVLLFPSYFFSHPLEIFKIWQGGLGIYGAVLAGLLVIFFYAKKHHFSFLLLLDLLAPGLILGQAIGRWGNYFNMELYGLPTKLRWGIPIGDAYYHPCFLYESLWNLGVFLILLLICKKKSPLIGEVFSFYLILYPLGRFLIEFLRIDEQPALFSLRLNQIISLVLIGLGLALLNNLFREGNKT